jgi:hypothetical protein
VLTGVVTTALVVFLAVAAVLSLPAARRTALAWHRPIRPAAAATLIIMAVMASRPLMHLG